MMDQVLYYSVENGSLTLTGFIFSDHVDCSETSNQDDGHSQYSGQDYSLHSGGFGTRGGKKIMSASCL